MNNKKKDIGIARELCIWKDRSECGDCQLSEEIFCHPQLKYMLFFALPLLIAIVPVTLGIIISDFHPIMKLIFFVGWIAYAFFFFFILESYVICNHCPYYANESQRVLHCTIDKGKLKTGKYNPGPTTTTEKIIFAIGALILIGYPVPFLIIGGLFVPLIFLIIGAIAWMVSIQLKVCTDCINFACPLNRVPKSIRDEFIKRNPIIRKAWEEKGYKFD